MTDQITPEIFDHLVDLGALELTPSQADYLLRELNNQLKSIHELEAVPLSVDIPISLHGIPFSPEISPALREDHWLPYDDPASIIEQAPLTADGYIVVPDIQHTTLE